MNRVKPIPNQVLIRDFINLLCRQDAKFGLLAQIGIETGLRVSDLLKLKYGAFNELSKALLVKEQKTGKYREIKITGVMRNGVWGLQCARGKSDQDYIFSGRDGTKPMHRSTVYRHLKRAGAQLGLEGIGTHSLRKTYAVGLFKASGGDLELVRERLNHKSSDTTLKHYIMSGISLETILKVLGEDSEEF